MLVLFGSKNSLVAFGAAADYLVPFNKHMICSFRCTLLQTHLPKSRMGYVFAGMYMIFTVYQSPHCLVYYHHKVPGVGGPDHNADISTIRKKSGHDYDYRSLDKNQHVK